MKHVAFVALFGALPMAASAQDFRAVTDQGEFIQIMSGRELTHRLYNLTIAVAPSGVLDGSAMGWDISGTWSWQDGYFCREMTWGDDPIPFNCQLVEVSGDQIRFTVDQGAGDSASFRLR
jgi:hypothetical protein